MRARPSGLPGSVAQLGGRGAGGARTPSSISYFGNVSKQKRNTFYTRTKPIYYLTPHITNIPTCASLSYYPVAPLLARIPDLMINSLILSSLFPHLSRVDVEIHDLLDIFILTLPKNIMGLCRIWCFGGKNLIFSQKATQ